jgi:hypothetical protein
MEINIKLRYVHLAKNQLGVVLVVKDIKHSSSLNYRLQIRKELNYMVNLERSYKIADKLKH